MTTLHIDFETRSAVDLKTVGLDNYSRHPTTDAWCMGLTFDDEPVICIPADEMRKKHIIRSSILRHAREGGLVVAHNAAFELAIWNNIMVPRYGWPELKPEQCRCTMAMAYAMALPGALEKAAAAVGIDMQKDMTGHRLMLQMCKPKPNKDGTLEWWDDADKLKKLYEYCRQDVRVERELEKRLMPLSAAEQRLWVLDHKINQRGIYVDHDSVSAATKIVQAEQDRLNNEMRRVTGNFVGFCTETARITKWVQSRGVMVGGFAKADVLDALDGPLPDDVRACLELRREAGKSSTAKLRAMTEAAGADGRLRGTLQYHGAATGRWAGRKVQLHNLPRPKIGHDEIERALALMRSETDPVRAAQALSVLYGPPLDIISWSLRGMLRAAPGNDLLVADFANIEGRGLAWLAGEDWKLDAFREFDAGTGPDLYLVAASRVYRKPIDECGPHRQTGKVSELSLGYQGGLGAFRKMEKALGIKLGLSDDEVQTAKQGWRDAHPAIVRYWYALEDAALSAVLTPGQTFSVGAPGRQVKFKVKGSFLWCLLPSGRALCYPYPKVKPIETPWGEMKDAVHYMTVDGTTNKWIETHTYGGKLSENVTQAICRDLLAASIERVEKAGFPVVLHVHDEVVSELPKDKGDFEEFKQLCAATPPWAAGLPVTTEGWRGIRYRK